MSVTTGEELRSIARQFAALEHAQLPREQIASALWYIWHVGRVTPDDLLDFARSHAGPTLENIMKTAAEQLLDRGRAEGEAKGRAEIVLKLIQLKFGAVPPEVARAVQAATIAQLDRWVERVLSAERAEDVVR